MLPSVGRFVRYIKFIDWICLDVHWHLPWNSHRRRIDKCDCDILWSGRNRTLKLKINIVISNNQSFESIFPISQPFSFPNWISKILVCHLIVYHTLFPFPFNVPYRDPIQSSEHWFEQWQTIWLVRHNK